jgi:hypothetical protein
MYGPFALFRREPEDGELAREAERERREVGIDMTTLLALFALGRS